MTAAAPAYFFGREAIDLLARRDPYNDGARPHNPHVVCHFTDALGRLCGSTEESLELWRSRLTEQDRSTPGVLDFPRVPEDEVDAHFCGADGA